MSVYIYESDSGFDLFLSPRELTDEERYCSHCNEYANLLKVTDDVNEMISLFDHYGYTPNTEFYKDLVTEFNDILRGEYDGPYSKETNE